MSFFMRAFQVPHSEVLEEVDMATIMVPTGSKPFHI